MWVRTRAASFWASWFAVSAITEACSIVRDRLLRSTAMSSEGAFSLARGGTMPIGPLDRWWCISPCVKALRPTFLSLR